MGTQNALYHFKGSFRKASRVAVVHMTCCQTPLLPRNGRTPEATETPAPVITTIFFLCRAMSLAKWDKLEFPLELRRRFEASDSETALLLGLFRFLFLLAD